MSSRDAPSRGRTRSTRRAILRAFSRRDSWSRIACGCRSVACAVADIRHGIGRLGHSLEGCPALADGDSMRRRTLRFGGTLLVTTACAAYLVWKIDLRELGHVLADA